MNDPHAITHDVLLSEQGGGLLERHREGPGKSW